MRSAPPSPAGAVLFDRDGTLVVDVPYNSDPALVRPVPGARSALDLLRGAGIPTGIVTNQSGIARGLLTADQAAAVTARVVELLGPFDAVRTCPHGPAAVHGGTACRCRKPAPGMVLDAAAELGVDPADVVVVGDIGADMGAALAAGARGVLVPTPVTRPEEVTAARESPRCAVAPDLRRAVELVLAGPVPAGAAGPGDGTPA